MKGGRHFNLLLLIGALIGAAAGFATGEMLIARFGASVSSVLLVGMYFAQLMLFISLSVLACEKIDARLNTQYWTRSHWKDSLKRLPLTSALFFFAVGCLLQFVYGYAPENAPRQAFDDYILAIDNSGSTKSTDPDKERFASTVSFVNGLTEKNQAAVIVFSRSTDVAVPLGKADDEFKRNVEMALSSLKSGGGTDIEGALTSAAGLCVDAKRRATVVLLSDGESKVDVQHVTDTYRQKGIVLNTVGFAFNRFEGTGLLEELSSLTGGEHYNVEDISQLSGTLAKIRIGQDESRNLLGNMGNDESEPGHYKILRVLFIALTVTLLSFALGFMLYNSDVIKKLLPQKILTGVAAGLIMEYGLFNISQEFYARLILALLAGLMVTFFKNATTSEEEQSLAGFELADSGGQGW
ncbi:MAG: VWA domain-containing protein [Clostridiales bacterium]|nr:VWA domain-containing protein [Clostridiales bacterium]